ncbi:MAG: class I SAM-dependent methyltransferase [Candidatus Thermoplasmatota archaeon]|nr:class I SAM-dependent methyltransferase [Candidatus Thermoplasmatota archaeon]
MSNTNNIFMPEGHMDQLYYSKNTIVRFAHNSRLNSITNEVPGKDKLKILDAGCGEGHLIERLYRKNKNNFYYGIDITKIAIQKAKDRCPYATVKLCDLSKINFDDGFFDVVICTEVLEHIYNYHIAITELKRVLRPEGLFIVTFPNEFLLTVGRFFLRRKPIKVPDHVNSFTPNKMIDAVSLDVIKKKNLPFNFPFFISLYGLIKFKK